MDRPKRTTQTPRLYRSRHVALASPLSRAFQRLSVLAGSVFPGEIALGAIMRLDRCHRRAAGERLRYPQFQRIR